MHAFVRSWQTLTFSPITVVFFRIIGTKNTANEVREEEEVHLSISTWDFYSRCFTVFISNALVSLTPQVQTRAERFLIRKRLDN